MTLAARKIIDIPPCLPFYITANTFSDVRRQLLKRIVVAHIKLYPPTTYHCCKTASNPAAIETFKQRKSRASSTKTRDTNSDDFVKAVQHKAPVDRATKLMRQTNMQGKDMERLSHSWCQEIDIADKYESCRTQFIDILSEL